MNLKFSGTVVAGSGLGKKMGFPTLNLQLAQPLKKIEHGIYAARVKTSLGEFPGALHYGPRPTTDNKITCEVHAIGLSKNLYGEKVDVEITARLRDIKKFKNLDELKDAIQLDVAAVKKIV